MSLPTTNGVLLHELHQAAQPLTVLQGLLELSLLKARTMDDFRDSVEAAIDQVQRVAACFNHVRQMLSLAELQLGALPATEREIQHV